MNRFKVIEGKEAAFEKRWAERESELKGTPGFVTFVFLRRDAVTADDGFNY
jgi:heme-degrading monooxygenase HmoA